MLLVLVLFALLGGLGYLYIIKQSVEETKTLISHTYAGINNKLWCVDAVFSVFCDQRIGSESTIFIGIGRYVFNHGYIFQFFFFVNFAAVAILYYLVKALFFTKRGREKLDGIESWFETISSYFFPLFVIFAIGVTVALYFDMYIPFITAWIPR